MFVWGLCARLGELLWHRGRRRCGCRSCCCCYRRQSAAFATTTCGVRFWDEQSRSLDHLEHAQWILVGPEAVEHFRRVSRWEYRNEAEELAQLVVLGLEQGILMTERHQSGPATGPDIVIAYESLALAQAARRPLPITFALDASTLIAG